jgi:hypothetical protein
LAAKKASGAKLGNPRKTWRAPAAKHFSGEIIVGKDLMVV